MPKNHMSLVKKAGRIDVRIGQPLAIKAGACPQDTFSGNVAEIAPIAVQKEEWNQERTVIVRARLENTGSLLKSGMTGTGKIYCGEDRLYRLLLRGIFRFFRIEVWPWLSL